MSAGTPAPAATPAAPAGTAPTAPAGQSPAAAPTANDPPAWAAKFMSDVSARLEQVEGGKRKAEADAAKALEEKAGAEKAKVTLEDRLNAVEAREKSARTDAAIGKAFAAYSYATPKHAEQARKVFEHDHRIEVAPDGSVLATGHDGKPQHLANSVASWAKGDGITFLASPAQPGAPGLSGAAPQSTTGAVKSPKDMTDAELNAAWKSGKLPDGTPIRGRLTPGVQAAPVFEFRNNESPFAKGRESVNAAFKGLMGRQR